MPTLLILTFSSVCLTVLTGAEGPKRQKNKSSTDVISNRPFRGSIGDLRFELAKSGFNSGWLEPKNCKTEKHRYT